MTMCSSDDDSYVYSQALDLGHLKRFVLDECDKMLDNLGEFLFGRHVTVLVQVAMGGTGGLMVRLSFDITDMRKHIQQIFRATPHEKQVMMFSATLSKEVRPICRKFCQQVRTQPPDVFGHRP